MVTSAHSGYSALQISLHWIIAALVITQLLNNSGMQEAWQAYENGRVVPGNIQGWAWFHAVIGATILILALVRL